MSRSRTAVPGDSGRTRRGEAGRYDIRTRQRPGAGAAGTGLAKEYATRLPDGGDLDIETGQFVAIMGPSGSGKSTRLHARGGRGWTVPRRARPDWTARS